MQRHVTRMLTRNFSLSQKVIAAVLLLLLLRLIWGILRDTPENLLEESGHMKTHHSVTVFPGHSCVMVNGKCVPTNEEKVSIPQKGLSAVGNQFYLDGQPFIVFSGSFHYFRTQPAQWGDRLLKMKAAGLNTVTTYIPWNLHEKIPSEYNFGGRWDVASFIQHVHKVGLKMIVRPGPYICAEWDYGGLPSWLLHDPKMVVRTSTYQPYLKAVEDYFANLFPILAKYQYRRGLGPIIAFQIENEYGSFGHDPKYMSFLKQQFDKWGLSELLFTADGPKHLHAGSMPGVLAAANFVHNPRKQLEMHHKFQPNKPVFVAEFWSGWFDHWYDKHHHFEPQELEQKLRIMLKMGVSVNFYMFVGGTNFEFWNGANNSTKGSNYTPTVTSYDYDAPISECGDVTPKFHVIRKLAEEFKIAKGYLPEIPKNPPKKAYGKVKMHQTMTFGDLMQLIKYRDLTYEEILPMELIYINKNGGQGYGWIVYRNQFPSGNKLRIIGRIQDRAQIFVNNVQIKLVDWRDSDPIIEIPLMNMKEQNTIDIIVENLGRVNYKYNLNEQRKGIMGMVYVDGTKLSNWKHVPLEFDEIYLAKVASSVLWKDFSQEDTPALYRGTLTIKGSPVDTFVETSDWSKGIVVVNGFNLGRYWEAGPQKTLYLPAPLLRKGDNEVILFELHKPASHISFVSKAQLG